ncbi:MAG TPA: 2-oxoglutarate dehydrogenase E1 component, partial [Flavilitoribacter sp.]|nr:2-oxoglutarate dehydrogenase E1 component [Flavilitoribacter sp.]
MTDFSFIANAHPSYIESLYDQYQSDPDQVESSWRAFFSGFEFAKSGNGHSGNGSAVGNDHLLKELRVLSLIKAYRDRAHLLSTTNPIRKRRDRHPTVNIEDFGLTEADLSTPFFVAREVGLGTATLQQIVDKLRKVYCGNIGFEYHHINDRNRRRWIRQRIESVDFQAGPAISMEKKRRILEKLNGAVIFERFLHTKYIGQKRFSLEGGE